MRHTFVLITWRLNKTISIIFFASNVDGKCSNFLQWGVKDDLARSHEHCPILYYLRAIIAVFNIIILRGKVNSPQKEKAITSIVRHDLKSAKGKTKCLQFANKLLTKKI